MTPVIEHAGATVYNGHALEVLRALPDCSVQTCVSSPPYFGLRDYGHADQIGLEKSPQEYVAHIVEIFEEVRRVLRDDGTLWLNLGDSYAAQGGAQVVQTTNANRVGGSDTQNGGMNRKPPQNFKPKDLCMIPARVAIALQDAGWYLRSDIIWSKPNPMPESVTDRPTKAHEYIFLLAKSQKYFYDAEAIREPLSAATLEREQYGRPRDKHKAFSNGIYHSNENMPSHFTSQDSNPNGRNRRSVWEVSTQPCSEAHFATFPPKLIEPCILAGSRVGDVVLDPFLGSGTTAMVATKLGRRSIGIELNPEYLSIIERRLNVAQAVLFEAGVAA